MAILEKYIDREDWLRWAIAFMQLGLWLDVELEVQGPHYPSGLMWGKVLARMDSTGENVLCIFLAKAHRSKYDPVGIRVFKGDVNEPVETDRFPLVEPSQLTPRARRWLRGAQRTAENYAWNGKPTAIGRKQAGVPAWVMKWQEFCTTLD